MVPVPPAGAVAGPSGAVPPPSTDRGAADAQRRDYVARQQRWLLFLRHCAKCAAPDGACPYGASCTTAKALWRHILQCADAACQYPRCVTSRELLKHHQKCTSTACPVCTPVKVGTRGGGAAEGDPRRHTLPRPFPLPQRRPRPPPSPSGLRAEAARGGRGARGETGHPQAGPPTRRRRDRGPAGGVRRRRALPGRRPTPETAAARDRPRRQPRHVARRSLFLARDRDAPCHPALLAARRAAAAAPASAARAPARVGRRRRLCVRRVRPHPAHV